ncbi:MAG: outer membrane beta-barrel protein [Bacteroidota bacterium]
MKSKVLTTVVLCMAALAVVAQGPIGKGQNQLNVGVGLSSWGIPVYVGFDHGVHQDVTLGGELSFRSYRNNYSNKDYNHSIIGISGNGNYHFNTLLDIPKSWDLYAGLNIGFYIWNSSSAYRGSGSSGLGLGAQIGGRYYITNKLGLNLELGGGNAFSGGKFGLTIRL